LKEKKILGHTYIFDGRSARGRSTNCSNLNCGDMIHAGDEAVYVGGRSRARWKHPRCYVDALGNSLLPEATAVAGHY